VEEEQNLLNLQLFLVGIVAASKETASRRNPSHQSYQMYMLSRRNGS
jgi:hypothetical protein